MTDVSPIAAILILAAGNSSRMGGADKLMEQVDGQALLHRQAKVALATGLPVWVALPPNRPLRDQALDGLACQRVVVRNAALGMSYSIIAGNAAIPQNLSLILWLADLPDITTDDFQRLLTAARQSPTEIVRATSEAGKPGHPVVFPPNIRGELASLSGDEGARNVLKTHAGTTVFVPLLGNRALTDLDTPEDWANWRKLRCAQD